MADVNQFSSLAGIAAEEEQIRKLREQRENDVRTLSSLVNAQQEGQNLEKDKANLLEKYNKLTEEAKSIGGILESGVEYQSPAGKMLYQAYNLPLEVAQTLPSAVNKLSEYGPLKDNLLLKAAKAALPEGKLESILSAAEAKPLNLSPESKLAYLNKLNSIDEQRLNIFEQLKKYSSDKQPALPVSELKAPEQSQAAPQSTQAAVKTEDGIPVVKAERLTPFDEFNIINQRRQQFIEDSMNDIASLPRGLRDRGMKLVKELADQSFKLPDNVARPVVDAATGQVIPGWRKVGDRLEKMESGKDTDKEEERMRELGVPGVGIARTVQEAKDLRAAQVSKKNADSMIDQLIEIANKPGSALSLKDRAAANQIKTMLQGALRLQIVGPGAVTDADRAVLDSVIANPAQILSFKDNVLNALNNLKRVNQQNLENQYESGIYKRFEQPQGQQQQQQGGQGGQVEFTRGVGGKLIIPK
jgi:hypothetical protein